MGNVMNLSMKIALAGMLFFCQTIAGQTNPYKIDDQLYAYYQRCNQVIKAPKVMLMADTLFQMATGKGDIKAQCLAKNLKADYYYYTNNIDSLLTEKEKVANFARKTPYKQYVFGAWNRIIIYYLRHREYDSAIQELKKYQDEAIRLNNSYGIGQSYILMGDVYFQQKMSYIAIKQYRQAADFYQSNGKENELYYPYYTISACYTNIRQYEEAEEYALKSLTLAPNEQAKVSSYLGLLRIYIKTNNLKKAEEVKNILVEYNSRDMIKGGSKQNYYIVLGTYYCETQNFPQAILYSDSIIDRQSRTDLKSAIYAKCGDFEKAYTFRLENSILYDSLTEANNAEILASYNARFNNQKLELEKNRLSLLNTEMRLKQLQDRERMILIEKERTDIELKNRDLQLEQQRTANQLEKTESQKQRLELMHKQEELERVEIEAEANERKTIGTICILALMTGFSIFYAFTRRQNAKRLQVEKDAAEEARRQAEKADRLKSAFLQNLSHEIRTPLNAIVGFNDLLNGGAVEFSPEERQEFLNHLHTNTDLLLTLVNDVLDLSKLESGNYNISLTNVSLPELCQSTLAGIAHRVAEGVKLELKQPETETIITTDAQRLQQILTNLLVNACKYTPEGSITLEYEIENDKIIFSVTDTGCGINEEKAEQIFQRFEKLDSFKPGFGLGLSICRSLTQLLGGKIYLDTKYAGGARFVVEFPL